MTIQRGTCHCIQVPFADAHRFEVLREHALQQMRCLEGRELRGVTRWPIAAQNWQTYIMHYSTKITPLDIKVRLYKCTSDIPFAADTGCFDVGSPRWTTRTA
jgi:hypothetical protein